MVSLPGKGNKKEWCGKCDDYEEMISCMEEAGGSGQGRQRTFPCPLILNIWAE